MHEASNGTYVTYLQVMQPVLTFGWLLRGRLLLVCTLLIRSIVCLSVFLLRYVLYRLTWSRSDRIR